MRKYTRLKCLICLIMVVILMVGCVSEKKETKVSTEKTITAKDILKSVVEYYEGQKINFINAQATGKIMVSDTDVNGLDVNFNYQHVVKDNKIALNNSKVELSSVYGRRTNKLDLYFYEDCSVAYSINNRGAYDVSDISAMLGIKGEIPRCSNVIDKEETNIDVATSDATDSPSATSTVIPTTTPTAEAIVETTSPIPNNSIPRKTLSISDLSKLSENLMLKGNKEIDGKEVYILKGVIDESQVKYWVTSLIDSNLYTLPIAYGDVPFNICVDKNTYEVVALDININNILQNVGGYKNSQDSIIIIKPSINKGTTIEMPQVQSAGLEKFTQVWKLVTYYSKIFANKDIDTNTIVDTDVKQ